MRIRFIFMIFHSFALVLFGNNVKIEYQKNHKIFYRKVLESIIIIVTVKVNSVPNLADDINKYIRDNLYIL